MFSNVKFVIFLDRSRAQDKRVPQGYDSGLCRWRIWFINDTPNHKPCVFSRNNCLKPSKFCSNFVSGANFVSGISDWEMFQNIATCQVCNFPRSMSSGWRCIPRLWFGYMLVKNLIHQQHVDQCRRHVQFRALRPENCWKHLKLRSKLFIFKTLYEAKVVVKCSRMFAHVFAVFLYQRAQLESLSQKLMVRLYVFESEGMLQFREILRNNCLKP